MATKKILLICWGLLGDTLMRAPLVEAVRAHYPMAHITAVVDEIGVQVFENHPAIDDVFLFSRKKKPRLFFLFRYFSRLIQLRARHFDLCIDFYYGRKTSNRVRFIKAKDAVGYVGFLNKKRDKAARRAFNIPVPFPHASDREYAGMNWMGILAKLLVPLGIAESAVRQTVSFFPTASAIKTAAIHCKNRQPFIMINLGAGGLEKCWPVPSFVALAEKIQAEYGYTIALVKNPGQAHFAQEFSALYEGDNLWCLPELSLDILGALLQHSACLITGDTGLMHVAFGVKSPVLGIFTYTRSEWVLSKNVKHVICFNASDKQNARGEYYGQNNISVDDVFSAFETLRAD